MLFKVLEWVFYKWELMLNASLTWLVSCLMSQEKKGCNMFLPVEFSHWLF